MSHVCTGLVQRKRVGSPTRKAVLMFMAGCAADDGSGIWTSKSNMAADLEMGKRTVQVCIDDLTEAGLISEVGRRPCKNGFTVEYQINMEAVSALESTRAGAAPVQEVHPTGAGAARQDVQELHPNLPLTVLKPSLSVKASFDDFWGAWPKKVAKGDARKAWAAAVKRAHPSLIIAGIKTSPQVQREAQFIPSAGKWLRSDGWEDEPQTKPSTPSQHAPGARKAHWQLMQERGTA